MVVNLEILKWTATAALVVGFGLFSAGVDFGWYIQIGGGVLWTMAALRMNDKPLLITNVVMITVGIVGKFLGN